ncbi:MAG: ABC transporter substrate-binding protein [Thermomicrobiales bacterium]|nr:ABC transporter substrate-binding protein [Thermomicrobiales bacterium]
MPNRNSEVEDRVLFDALAGRISRRDILKGAAAAGLGASIATTIADDVVAAAAYTPALQADVPRERTLIVVQGGGGDGQNPNFDNFNLWVTASQWGWHSGPLQTMNEPLIMFNVLTGEYENWLAESWEYNADFTEITMKLREGIEWSDGTPFTASDVEFTFNSVRDRQNEATNAAEIVFLKEAVADDDLTVRFVLNEANPRWWATTLTSNHGVVEQMMPKHIWEGQDLLTFTNYDPEKGWPVATGPYKLVSTSSQQKIFDLRQDWWGAKTGWKPLPKVERVIFLALADDTLSAQQLITNEVDMGKILSVPTLQATMAQNAEVLTFSLTDPPYGYLDWCPIDLNINCAAAPWDDPKLRWAVSNAIDRTSLVALAEGGAGVVALHQFTPYEWFTPFEETLQPIFEQYGLDTASHLDKSEALMTELGYAKNGDGMWEKDGEVLKMAIFVPDWLKAYGPPLTQQLRDAGFDATFDTSPGLGTPTQTGEQILSLGCKGPAGVKGMDPYFMLSIYMSQYFRPTGEPAPIWWALSRWQNEEYDAVVEQMNTLSADAPETMELFRQAMEIWVRELPDVYLAQLIIRYPMSSHYWTGWPTKEDAYGFPHSWQQEFMKTILRLEPTS